MSIIFNGTEVTDIVMDGVSLDAVIFNDVCVFGKIAYLVDGSTFASRLRSLAPNYAGSQYSVVKRIEFSDDPLEETGNRVLVSTIDSPLAIYADRVLVRSSGARFEFKYVVYPEVSGTLIVFNEDCQKMFSAGYIADRSKNNSVKLTGSIVSFPSIMKTDRIRNYYRMFYGSISEGGYEDVLDLSRLETDYAENMSGMFEECISLKTIIVGNRFNTSKVVEDSNMFLNCSILTGQNGTTYSSNHTDKEYARIDTAETPGYFTLAT